MGTYIDKRAAELRLPIVDAKESLVLEVVPQDVTRAQAKNSRCCALVRACERQMPNVRAAFFLRSTAYLEFDDRIERFNLPMSVQKEIISFDRNRVMEPGVYQLTRPRPGRSLEASKKRKRIEKRTGAHHSTETVVKRQILRHRTSGIRTGVDPSYRAAK